MVNHYPPVKQLETIMFEAEQRAQLRREVRELRRRRPAPERRSWGFVIDLLRHNRHEEQMDALSQTCGRSRGVV